MKTHSKERVFFLRPCPDFAPEKNGETGGGWGNDNTKRRDGSLAGRRKKRGRGVILTGW